MYTLLMHAGRLAMRIAFDSASEDLEVVHINDLASAESSAYLLQFDSVHGQWGHNVTVNKDGNIEIEKKDGTVTVVTYSQCKSPEDIDCKALGVDIVLEGTGVFLTRKSLQPYFDNGAKKVVVTAPVKDKEAPVTNIVYGVNHNVYNAVADNIVTAASCTTNCLAPVVKVIQEHLKIKHGCITTVHDVTNTQSILDAPNAKKSDLRRARYGFICLKMIFDTLICVFLIG